MAGMYETNLSKVARAADDIAGNLADAKLGLTKAPLPLNEDTTYANVDDAAHKANFDGYARHNIDWSDPYIAEDGQIECLGTTTAFRPTGDTVPNDIIACTVTNAANDELLFIGNIDGQPVTMNTELDSLTLIVRFRPAAQTLSVAVV